MQLITSRLRLRPVIASDADDLFRIYGDPATNTFNPAGPYPDIDYARDVLACWLKHWKHYGFGNWAITLKDDPERIIGFGGLSIRSYADITINNLDTVSPLSHGEKAWRQSLLTMRSATGLLSSKCLRYLPQ